MELLTVQETAQMLKVAPITVRRYIASGRLAAVKIGRGVRIRREAIEGLLTPLGARGRHSRDGDETFLAGRPPTEDDSPVRVIDTVGADEGDDGPADEGGEGKRRPEESGDGPTPARHVLLRIAAIGDALAPGGEPSDIASDKYPYLGEIYAPPAE